MMRRSRLSIAVLAAAYVLSGAALAAEDIAGLTSRLSAGDRSVLVAALQRPDSQMMTIEGSANDVFWSALERMGLMQQHPVPKEMADKLAGTGVKPKIFSVTDKGTTEIPTLVEWARKP